MYLDIVLNINLDMSSAIDMYSVYTKTLYDKSNIINDKLKNTLKMFDSLNVNNVSVKDYCYRFSKYLKISPSCFIYAICILDKCIDKNIVIVTSTNILKLTLTMLLLSAKMLEDDIYNNEYWARLGGVDLTTINKFEKHILESIDYKIHFDLLEYKNKLNRLRNAYLRSLGCYYN